MILTRLLRLIASVFGAGRRVQRRYEDKRPWEPDHLGALRRHQQANWFRFGGACALFAVLAMAGVLPLFGILGAILVLVAIGWWLRR